MPVIRRCGLDLAPRVRFDQPQTRVMPVITPVRHVYRIFRLTREYDPQDWSDYSSRIQHIAGRIYVGRDPGTWRRK